MIKYKLGEVESNGLRRVIALKDFGIVKKGDVGGFVASERNLSQEGKAWVSDNARVFGNARVSDNARVYGDAGVFGNAWVSDNARVSDNAKVFGNARVSDNARVFGDAWVSGDARVFGNAWVSGDFDVNCDIDFVIPSVTLDSTSKALKLKKFIEELNKEDEE